MTTTELPSLRRQVHAVLLVALSASVAANVLAAEPTVVARGVAAWPPVALLLVVDVLGRTPSATGWAGRAARVAAGGVAGLASFAHVRSVALAVGESELVAWLLPLSVDGLAVVCSVALVEINHRMPEPSLDQQPDLVLEEQPDLVLDQQPEPAGEPGFVLAGLPVFDTPAPAASRLNGHHRPPSEQETQSMST